MWRPLALAAAVGVLSGLGAALFLRGLELATTTRQHHDWLIWLLPLAGAVMGATLLRLQGPAKGGTNLVLDAVHEPELAGHVPLRLAPLAVLGTWWTHLFGGSAGREGAAVQMAASLADALVRLLKLPPGLRQIALTCGMAGGFGAVFGTPLAGALFGVEVGHSGRLDTRRLGPALLASLLGDAVAQAAGASHAVVAPVHALALTLPVLLRDALLGVAIAATASLYLFVHHWLQRRLVAHVPDLRWRMALTGAGVVLVWKLSGSQRWLGLGTETIAAALAGDGIYPWDWAAKLTLTAWTLAGGFLGGEVTPLFFVGATLGHTLAGTLGLPADLAAGVGLAGVFAAVAHTPLALTVMAAELLGGAILPHALVALLTAWLLMGERRLFVGQRV
jgi:H+/Cl- antiporter ClcA